MIQYPNKKPPYQMKQTPISKRGMTFEALLDESNVFYRAQNIAIVHKKPTPVQIVNVNYPSRNKAKIVEAYYKTPSTTDYNGIYQGYYIDFDVKETQSATSFPLKNVHAHQIKHLAEIDTHGGIAFLLIYFTYYDQVFLLKFIDLKHFMTRAKTGRKSIAYDEIQAVGILVDVGFRPRIDYLKAVKQCIETQTQLPLKQMIKSQRESL